jgi:hypothetical protein|eukprot:7383225-Prymnesium_polylepis.2
MACLEFVAMHTLLARAAWCPVRRWLGRLGASLVRMRRLGISVETLAGETRRLPCSHASPWNYCGVLGVPTYARLARKFNVNS